MSNSQGRRKQEQTVPLIFERVRSRVTREVTMPAKIAEDLSRYIEWACDKVGADHDEAMTLVMEQALSQFFQRDRLFQDEGRATETASPKPTGGGSPPTTTSSSTGGLGKGSPPPQPSTAARPAVTQ